MGQKEFRVQASACLFAGREDMLKLALLFWDNGTWDKTEMVRAHEKAATLFA
jgi:hypothetical protein